MSTTLDDINDSEEFKHYREGFEGCTLLVDYYIDNELVVDTRSNSDRQEEVLIDYIINLTKK